MSDFTCARLRVVRVPLVESRVDDLDDVVDGDRRLGDVVVAGKTLRAPGGVGDLGLYAARQVGVDEDLNAEAARVRCCSVSRADSISSCPVKKLSTSRAAALRDEDLQRRHTAAASGALVYIISTG